MSGFRLVIAACAMLAAHPVIAQSSVVLWPTDPKIEAGEQATALWLENRGTQPVTLQVRTLGWDQASGEDRQEATNAVVSSPPIAEVGPGQRQLVRIIRRGAPVAGESAYRLLIDELPRPPAAGEGPVAAQLHVQMRYSLSLFSYGADSAGFAPRLSARITLDEGRRWVEISNSGNGHARLTDLRVSAGGRVQDVQAGLIGYVLPGATMRWPLPNQFDAMSSLIVAANGRDTPLSGAI